jgi:hypothetical protein
MKSKANLVVHEIAREIRLLADARRAQSREVKANATSQKKSVSPLIGQACRCCGEGPDILAQRGNGSIVGNEWN